MARTYRCNLATLEYGWVLSRAARILVGYWQLQGAIAPFDRHSKEGRYVLEQNDHLDVENKCFIPGFVVEI